MGIKDLYKLIEQECPDLLLTFSFDELSGFRMAVDTSAIVYRLRKSVGDDWQANFISIFCSLRKAGIYVLCVFDGPDVSPEKKKLKQKRDFEAKKRIEKVRTANSLLERFWNNKDGDDITNEANEFLTTIKKGNGELSQSKRLEEFISKTTKQIEPVNQQHFDQAKVMLKLMGIPFFQSKGESDGHCAWLSKNGMDAVLTEDTDVLVYGCPIFFSFRNFKIHERKLNCINLEMLLRGMGFVMSEFKDLCILLSCDYNMRVKGFPPTGRTYKKPTSIGFKGALAMIRQYRTLEFSTPYIHNIKDLNYKVCRQYFSADYPVFENEINKSELDIDKLIQFIQENRLLVDCMYVRNSLSPSRGILC